MMHPITYLNKLVFWSGNKVFLHNVIEDELIFSFKPMISEVESIVQSPVVDVVAIGCLDGSIMLWNLKFD